MSKLTSSRRPELLVSLGLTVCIVVFHVLRLFHAGGLWRDEAAAVQLATMPHVSDIFKYFPHEAFPPPFFLLIRCWSFLFHDSDFGYRLFGCLAGLSIVAALWWTMWTVRGTPPLLSLALIGFNGAFVQWGDEVRGYGLGVLFILLTVGTVWRVVERATPVRVAAATIATILATQVLLHNALLVLAVCAAGMLTAWRSGNNRGAGFVLLCGTIAAVCLLPYPGPLHEAREWDMVVRTSEVFVNVTAKLMDALGASGVWNIPLWFLLILVALWICFTNLGHANAEESSRGGSPLLGERDSLPSGVEGVKASNTFPAPFSSRSRRRKPSMAPSLPLFCGTALLLGLLAYFSFLGILSYPTQAWYYLAVMGFSALLLDLAFQPWERFTWLVQGRLALAGVLSVAALIPTWHAARVRLTNTDQVASRLSSQSGPRDLIVVMPWTLGISFNRYYHGSAPWVTIPCLDFHRFHRYDLVRTGMIVPDQTEPIRPALDKASDVLKGNGRVFVVSIAPVTNKVDALPPLAPAPDNKNGWNEQTHTGEWCVRAVAYLQGLSLGADVEDSRQSPAVNRFEDLIITRFSSGP